MQITMEGKYTTHDGKAVRLLCVDGPNPTYPVVGFVEGEINWATSWTLEGAWDKDDICKIDLVPVPTWHGGRCIIRDD
jgi:hypothetical protein